MIGDVSLVDLKVLFTSPTHSNIGGKDSSPFPLGTRKHIFQISCLLQSTGLSWYCFLCTLPLCVEIECPNEQSYLCRYHTQLFYLMQNTYVKRGRSFPCLALTIGQYVNSCSWCKLFPWSPILFVWDLPLLPSIGGHCPLKAALLGGLLVAARIHLTLLRSHYERPSLLVPWSRWRGLNATAELGAPSFPSHPSSRDDVHTSLVALTSYIEEILPIALHCVVPLLCPSLLAFHSCRLPIFNCNPSHLVSGAPEVLSLQEVLDLSVLSFQAHSKHWEYLYWKPTISVRPWLKITFSLRVQTAVVMVGRDHKVCWKQPRNIRLSQGHILRATRTFHQDPSCLLCLISRYCPSWNQSNWKEL